MSLATAPHLNKQDAQYRSIVTLLGVIVFVFSIAALLQLAASYQFQLGDVHDDAYISFRYAANLVHGHGLVYNPGEYVEGYTNFLWVLTSALALRLGFDPVFTTYVLNMLFGVGLLLLVGWFGVRLAAWGRVAPGLWPLAVAALALSNPLAYALVSGLESALFTLLLTAAAFSFVLEQRGAARLPLSGLLFALAALTRPEAVLFWALTVLYQFISLRITPSPLAGEGWGEGSWRNKFGANGRVPSPLAGQGWGEGSGNGQRPPSPNLPQRGRGHYWLVGGFLIIWLPYMAWKVFYYGSIFPNTFYDKATGNNDQFASGLGYVAGAWPYLFGPLAFMLIIAALLWRRRLGRIEGYFALLIAVNFAYVAYVGGDYLIAYRFLLPLFPLLALLLVGALSGLVQAPGRATLGTLLAGGLLIFALSPYVSLLPGISSKLHDEQGYNRNSGAAIGWLQTNAAPTDTLAIETVGRIPYYTGLYTIDMLGLTDSHIAHGPGRTDRFTPGHNKFDIGYVLSRQPTYIMVYRIPMPDGTYGVNQKYMPASMALVANQQFAASYTNVAHFPMWPGVEGWLYKHNP